jgi:hypothetical protein
VSLRLAYLAVLRLFGWLILLAHSNRAKDHEDHVGRGRRLERSIRRSAAFRWHGGTVCKASLYLRARGVTVIICENSHLAAHTLVVRAVSIVNSCGAGVVVFRARGHGTAPWETHDRYPVGLENTIRGVLRAIRRRRSTHG